ncbi:PDR/VanB family oxidoreductase [Pseudonocardia xishanensis]|uniref:PDR/VanB family oxidoreductase n=1 Tax=Pseudonocardia xishanensis TaxID=630995 RepID=A0ABP8RU91_9PSEU
MTSVDPPALRQLRVQEVRHEAAGVVSVLLVDPAGEPLPAWEPGAHLELVLPSGLLRQYSLCGPEGAAGYRVAVLREAEGRGGSREIHDVGLVGRTLGVRGPRNHFSLADAPSHLLIAGGIGVTPMLAMARRLAATGQDWRMVYGGRTRESMAFVDELRSLGPVDIVPQDELGHPDLAAALDSAAPGTVVYACGPAPLLAAVEEATGARSLALRVERFAADPDGPSAAPAAGGDFEVELRRSGVTRQVPADRSLLDVVREVVPDAPASCEEGFCGSCETKVLAGVPEHRDTVLDDEERASNATMMICVGRCLSGRLVLDV